MAFARLARVWSSGKKAPNLTYRNPSKPNWRSMSEGGSPTQVNTRVALLPYSAEPERNEDDFRCHAESG
jgi:hypothetical protein